MIKWFARIAYEIALYSAGVASASGMHQPKEPDKLCKVVDKRKAMKQLSK